MAKTFKIYQDHEGRIEEARQAELNEDVEEAVSLYEEAIAGGYSGQFAFDRLMLIYRKQKKYKDELRIINKGIGVFSEANKKQLEESISSKKNKKEIEKLSKAFMKSSGLVDRKGREVHVPEPINKWIKRKEVVDKKLKKK
jgi:hypothetical protein